MGMAASTTGVFGVMEMIDRSIVDVELVVLDYGMMAKRTASKRMASGRLSVTGIFSFLLGRKLGCGVFFQSKGGMMMRRG